MSTSSASRPVRTLLPEEQNRGGEFVALALALLRNKGSAYYALKSAHAERLPDRVVRVLEAKAAVPAGTTTDPNWASALLDLRVLARGFLDSLRGRSVFDTLLPDAINVPMRTRIAATTVALTGSVVGEGGVKPISSLTLDDNMLEPRKSTAILVLSEELIRSAAPGAMAFLSRELRAGVSNATDLDFLSALQAAVTAVPSTGSDAASILADIEALLAELQLHAGSRLFLIVEPAAAARLAILAGTGGAPAFPQMTISGGTIGGISVVPSDQLAAGVVVLVDASGVAAASDIVTIDASGSALLQMADNPASGEQSQVSLYQTNSRALKAERWFAYQIARSNSVAALSGASWWGTGS